MRTTTAMAADLSGVPKRTIQRWAAEGRITSEVRAGKVYVNAAEVEQLAEHRHAGRLPRHLTDDQLVAHSAHSVPVVSAGANAIMGRADGYTARLFVGGEPGRSMPGRPPW